MLEQLSRSFLRAKQVGKKGGKFQNPENCSNIFFPLRDNIFLTHDENVCKVTKKILQRYGKSFIESILLFCQDFQYISRKARKWK